jgi:hypothetical protein
MKELKFTTSQISAASENCQDADLFFHANDIVYSEFVPDGQTVNQAYYVHVLKRLRDAVRRKRPELWQSGEWWLHHDNAPAHKAFSVK